MIVSELSKNISTSFDIQGASSSVNHRIYKGVRMHQ
jgi:hypothetical protein